MHRTQRQVWLNRIALVVLSATTLSVSGCAKLYHLSHYNFFAKEWADHQRTYYHSPYTGRIIAKEHGHFCVAEPPCFGYEPTCWTPWPAQCPQQCNQPCLTDTPLILDEVMPSTPSVISSEPLPGKADAGAAKGTEAEGEADASADAARTPDAEADADADADETGWREAAPPQDSPEPDDSSGPAPLQKQPLDGQPTNDAVLPLPVETAPVIAWDTSVPRREIEQHMVFVEETTSRPDSPIEPDADVSPIVLSEDIDSPSTVTEQSPMPLAGPETQEPRPERLALRVDATDPAPAPVTPPQATTVEPTLPATDAGATGTAGAAVEPNPPVGPSAPVTETTSVLSVPSFKITAVLPPVRVSNSTAPTAPRNAQGATIRFASEASSSLRVGDARHSSGNDTTLRFR